MKRISAVLALLLSYSTVFAQPSVHDPALAFCNGKWYMYTTGFGIDVRSSTDLLNWNLEKQVFESAPKWAVDMVPRFFGHIWAPDIFFHDDTYYLYYSCSSFGKNTSAIGVATNKTLDPAGSDYKWLDHGCVVNSVAGRDLWNAIDPNAVEDEDGNVWLAFGSFWGGIKLVKLDSTLTRPAEPQIWYPLCRRPEGTADDTSLTDDAIKADPRGKDFDPGNGAVEAPFIYKKDGYYYLFVSYDLCCRGPKSNYKVVVGRSKAVTGPYYDSDGIPLMSGGGTVVISGNDRFPGVGHCAVVEFDGKDKLVVHGYDRDDHYNSRLIVRDINWDADGWPSAKL